MFIDSFASAWFLRSTIFILLLHSNDSLTVSFSLKVLEMHVFLPMKLPIQSYFFNLLLQSWLQRRSQLQLHYLYVCQFSLLVCILQMKYNHTMIQLNLTCIDTRGRLSKVLCPLRCYLEYALDFELKFYCLNFTKDLEDKTIMICKRGCQKFTGEYQYI